MGQKHSQNNIDSVTSAMKAAESRDKNIDYGALFLVIKLIYCYGLAKNRISSLKMSDIFETNFKVKEKIVMRKTEILLDATTSAKFKDYINTIKTKNNTISMDAPLFDRYKKCVKTFDRDLKQLSSSVGFNQIRDIGAFIYCKELENYYAEMHPKSAGENDIIYKIRRNEYVRPLVAKRFGVTESGAYRKVTGTMPAAGKSDSDRNLRLLLGMYDFFEQVSIPENDHDKFLLYIIDRIKISIDIINKIKFKKPEKRRKNENGTELEVPYTKEDAIEWIINKLKLRGVTVDLNTMTAKLSSSGVIEPAERTSIFEYDYKDFLMHQ